MLGSVGGVMRRQGSPTRLLFTGACVVGLFFAGMQAGQIPEAKASGPVPQSRSPQHSIAAGCGGSLERVTTQNVADAGNQLFAIAAISADEAWAVGVTTPKLRLPTPLVERGGTAGMSIVDTPALPEAASLVGVASIGPSDAWAVGSQNGTTLAEHWDGQAWQVVATPNPGESENFLADVAASGSTDAWAVGGQIVAHFGDEPLALHWDGAAWTAVPPAYPAGGGHFQEVTSISADDAWAVGWQRSPRFTFAPLIEHWDGSAWNVVDAPTDPYDAQLLGVSASGPSDVWVAGFKVNRRGVHKALFEHFDGAVWSPVPGAAGLEQLDIQDVTAVSAQEAWAVGFMVADDTMLVEHWDGSKWSRVQAPGGQRPTELLSVNTWQGQTLWVAGETKKPGSNRWTTLVEAAC